MAAPAKLDEGSGRPPAAVPYLYPRELHGSAASLVEAAVDHLRVGIVWRGDARRSPERVIALEDLATLASVGGVQLLSLQFDETSQERAICERAGIVSLGSALGDFAQTAAIVLRLDLVVTVDTAMAHLAGALGMPVWVLLPEHSDWRWMLDREDSPWYPTMRLFRQRPDEPRVASIERARAALVACAELPRVRRPLRRRSLHRFQIRDTTLLAYDEMESKSAGRVAGEILEDVYGLDDILFRSGDVVIDIGAHVGLVSLYLAKRWPFLRICAFEPYSLNYENCAENLWLNNVSNVRLFRQAITSDRRSVVLKCMPANTGGATEVFKLSGTTADAPVDSMTLDDILDQMLAPGERCRLLKLDCEGAEYEILRNARQLDRIDHLAAEFHEPVVDSSGILDTGIDGSARALVEHCGRFFAPEQMRIVYCPKED